MEISARNSTTKVVTVIILGLMLLLVISMSASVYLALTNRYLINHRQVVVTPMMYNAPFAVSEVTADAEAFQMMALSFLALRLNVSPETVDGNHQSLLAFVKPEAHAEFKDVLADEARQIKQSNVNSAFYSSDITVYPADNRVDVRGLLKTWIGPGKPSTEIKEFRLTLDYVGGRARIAKFVEVKHEK